MSRICRSAPSARCLDSVAPSAWAISPSWLSGLISVPSKMQYGQAEFAEHGLHPLPELDLREQIGGQCRLPVGRCGAGVSDGHGAEKKFPILAQRHFPG